MEVPIRASLYCVTIEVLIARHLNLTVSLNAPIGFKLHSSVKIVPLEKQQVIYKNLALLHPELEYLEGKHCTFWK